TFCSSPSPCCCPPVRNFRYSGAFAPKIGDFEYDRSLIDSTLMLYQSETPTDTAFIDLALIIPTFLEKGRGAPGQPRLWQPEKLDERSQRPRGNHVRRLDLLPHRFNSRRMSPCRDIQMSRSGAEERRLFPSTFDEIHSAARLLCKKAGRHDAGKTATGADIQPVPGISRQRKKLRAVQNMARPKLVQGRRRCKIDRLGPFAKQLFKGDQTVRCFT